VSFWSGLLEDIVTCEQIMYRRSGVASPPFMTWTPQGTDGADAQITVNVLMPGARRKVTTVHPSSPVGVLKGIAPNTDLVFQGQILIDSQTFSFYGIQADDLLVALRRPREIRSAGWKGFVPDEDFFGDATSHLTHRSAQAELLRLQDAHAIRMETRPRWFRRLCRDMELNGRPPPSGKIATQIPREATAISSAPLPICW
jgi:hypothetical protein